jgi:2-polyprenyl-3-methyl-5-hydroxy-6-metoxy-1,4-benzoquinol methylase
VASERDLTSELAREIRAAVAEISPPAAPENAPASSEERAFRLPLARASEHVTPTIPDGVRLARGKNLAIRALKFLWRDQAAFNTLLIETVNGLADRVNSLARSLANALDAERQALGREIERIERWREEAERAGSETRRRAAIQDGRLAVLEASGAPARPALSPLPAGEVGSEGFPVPSLPPGVYSLFEERFRGSPEEISEKQRSYLPLFKNLPGPVLDVGCGRGELLSLLAAGGIPAAGVEVNPLSVASCRSHGLSVEEGDGMVALAARPDGSLGAVVALQVVEHWRAETTFAFLREARRALAPGGVLIAETINSDSLSALKAFFLDPSHVRPVPPDALLFLAEAAGFVDARIEYRSPLSPGDRLEEVSTNEAKLNRLLYGPQDYALIAHAPRAIGK